MEQSVKHALIYAALTTAVVGCASMLALLLLCWLTPSVTVLNTSQWPIKEIVVQLPSNRLSFDGLAPGQESQIFYDADQAEGAYIIHLQRNNVDVQVQCGHISHGEWGKRMQIIVHDTDVECREQLRY